MSATTKSDNTDTGTFEEHIANDPDICYNCYRRWRDTMERNYAVENDGYVRPLRRSLTGVVKAIRPAIEAESGIFHAEETEGQYPVCDCGTPFESFRPVDIDTAKRYADRICNHLHRKGVDFDEDEFYAQMFKMKRKPDKQYKIDMIFKKALQRSV